MERHDPDSRTAAQEGTLRAAVEARCDQVAAMAGEDELEVALLDALAGGDPLGRPVRLAVDPGGAQVVTDTFRLASLASPDGEAAS